jgi:hypothetical protein
MFSIADLVVVAGLKDALDFLSKNPSHIEFLLGQFCQEPILKIVGQEYVKKCIDAIQEQRIEVAPYYQMDLKKRPSIAVVASYTEDIQFMGDYGSENPQALTLPAKKYVSFDAIDIDGCKIVVSSALNLDKILWHGLILSNGKEKAKLTGILKKDNSTEIFIDKELPKNTKLSGWGAYSGIYQKGYLINSSVDTVNVQCNFQSVGDYSVHRLMATIIRACLKKQRLWFDSYGLQVSTFSQTPPILSEEAETEFQTIFTINGKVTDSWIAKEYELPDEAAKIVLEIVADSGDDDKDEVVLE